MVGEIRDAETARLAVQASLTGHLVLSTLHTNDAVGAMARLLDMGIEFYLLNAVVRAVLAQRLVRRLCPSCKEPADDVSAAEALGLSGEALKGVNRAVGCHVCNGSGYHGRLPLTELLVLNREIRDAIAEGAPVDTLAMLAADAGMTTMLEDGRRAVASRRGGGGRSSGSAGFPRMTDIGLEAAGVPARGAAAPRDLAMFFRQFSTILNAGLPVDRALDLLSRDREDRTTAKLAEPLLQQVRMGTPLATAMTREGALFGPFAVSVTRAAEAAGDLGHAAGTLADHFEQRAALLDEIRSTLTYPAVLFAASALAVIVLFVVVVPQFEPLFDRSGADIPTTTATVLAVSRWMVAWGGWTGIAIAVLAAGLMLPAAARCATVLSAHRPSLVP